MKTSVSKPEMNTLQSFFTNDRIMLALVFVNTLFIFVGGYFTSSRFFIWVDSLFTVLFLMEIAAKVSTYGWKDYWKDGWDSLSGSSSRFGHLAPWGGDGARMIEEVVNQLRHMLAVDGIEVEVARNGGMTGNDDTATRLFETDMAVVAEKQDAVAVSIGEQGCIYAATVSVEVTIALLQSPESIAPFTAATGGSGHRTVADPLYTVYPLDKQEGDAEF